MKNTVETKSGIYCIINKVNQKIYVGSSKNLETRKKQHFNRLKNNSHCNCLLQNSYNKHGEKNFEFKILKYCSQKNLIKWEQYYIYNMNSNNFNIGYNIDLKANKTVMCDYIKEKIGKGNSGKKQDEKWIAKRIKTGWKHKKETIEKIRAKKLGKKRNYIRIFSEETREKIRKSNTGKKQSKETIEKRLQNTTWKNHTEEHKAKISKLYMSNGNPFFGKKHTEESRKKMKESQILRFLREKQQKEKEEVF